MDTVFSNFSQLVSEQRRIPLKIHIIKHELKFAKPKSVQVSECLPHDNKC